MERAQVLEAISSMTVLELSQLIKDMEAKFGVSAAAAVAVAAPAAGGAAAPAAAEEQTEFTVVLTAFGDNKGNVIKAGPGHGGDASRGGGGGGGPGGGRPPPPPARPARAGTGRAERKAEPPASGG